MNFAVDFSLFFQLSKHSASCYSFSMKGKYNVNSLFLNNTKQIEFLLRSLGNISKFIKNKEKLFLSK